MLKVKHKIVFYLLSGGVVSLILFVLWHQSFNASRGYWEAEIENEGPQLAMTLRLMGSESKPVSRQIVFQGIKPATIQSGTYQLPDEAASLRGIRMTFQDMTIRPGRVRLELKGHEIDIMTSGITIDSEGYAWNKPEPIEISD